MKNVLGKELIITKKQIKALFERFFGQNLLIQDLWFDQQTQEVHIKVGRTYNVELEKRGFKPIMNPAEYPTKEVLDDKIEQLLQSTDILGRSW